MKKLIPCFLLFASLAHGQLVQEIIANANAGGGGALVNSVVCTSVSGNGCTTSATNMTGADFCIVAAANGNATSAPSVSPQDSNGNIWFGKTIWYSSGATISGSPFSIVLWYAPDAIVSGSQTFTLTSAGTYPAFVAACYSGINLSSPLDQFTGGNTTSALNVTLGALTPNTAGEALITAMVMGGSSSNTSIPTINSSFSVRQAAKVASGTEGYGFADFIETAITAKGPTWTYAPTTNEAAAALMMSFMPTQGTQLYDIFFNNETSTSGTGLTTTILANSMISTGQNNPGTANFNYPGTGGGTAEILSQCQSPPALTPKNVGGVTYTDSAGTRGQAFLSISGNPAISWRYEFPTTTPTAQMAYWIWPGIAAGETGTYYSMGGFGNTAGDSLSTMFHNGTVYPETSLNPNGADDVGSAYTWTSGASTSTITVGTGTQNFTTSTSLGLAANSWVGVFNSLALTNGMLCQVTSDTGTALDTSCTIAYGSGSFSSWIIIPWYYMDEQFVGWKANGTSATSLTIGTGTQTLTTGTGLNYAAGQAVVISVTGTPGEFMSGSVTSYNSSSGSLVANIVTTGGTCSACTSWTVSNSAHTMHIYDSAGNLVSTQIKAADPSDAGNPIYFGLGFGGDGTDAGNIFCFDGITAQWIGAPEYPIEP